MFVKYRVGVGVVRWPFALLDVFPSLREFERGLFDVHRLIDGRGVRLATVLARAEARVNHLVCADVARGKVHEHQGPALEPNHSQGGRPAGVNSRRGGEKKGLSSEGFF